MAYFSTKQDGIERGGKLVADVSCAVLIAAFSVIFFGAVGGILAFILLEGALLAVDYLVPDEDDAPGVVR